MTVDFLAVLSEDKVIAMMTTNSYKPGPHNKCYIFSLM